MHWPAVNLVLNWNKMSNTVRLHRIIKSSPEKVFRAFTDPLAKSAWLPPYGFLCTVDHFDVRVGGTYKMTFHNFGTGSSHSWKGEFLEIIPNALIKYADVFDDPNLPGQMITTITMKEVLGGTELNCVQEGIPEMIPVSMCYLGWQESLEKLAKLVEPVIPDA
jgi:uncharacterized protein YndB with AHSA1/START domain